MSEDAQQLDLSRSSEDAPVTATVERRPSSLLTWGLVALSVLVVAIGVGGAVFGAEQTLRDDEPTLAPTPTTPPATAPSAATPPTPAAVLPSSSTSTPSIDVNRVEPYPGFSAPFGSPLPERVPPFEGPDDLVLVGHSPGARLAVVRPDGSVEEWLAPGGGPGFLPQAVTTQTMLGFAGQGAGAMVVHGDGSAFSFMTDNRDAPVFFPRADGTGYVVHGSWLGRVTYLGLDGTETGTGPELARGSVMLGDTSPGLAVRGLDGITRILDRADGSTIVELRTEPLAVAGGHQVVVRCSNPTTCRAEIQDLAGMTTAPLPIDPLTAHRVVMGMSPDGRSVAYLQYPSLHVIGTDGTPGPTFTTQGVDRVLWSGDTVAVVAGHEVQLWSPGMEVPAVLDLGSAIDPSARGLLLLRDPTRS